MKKIETVITRDNSLIDVYAWHKGYGDGLKEWLGWAYTDSVFYIHDGYTEIMRPPEEHKIEFRNFVLNKINTDPLWLIKEADTFDGLVGEIYTFYDQSIKKIKDGVSKIELATIYEKYVDFIARAMGPFITMYWIPAWVENETENKEKYQKEINIALQYRKKTEHLFPRGAELTELILKQVQNEENIEDKFLRVISAEELSNFLKENKEIDVVELQKRLKGFVFSKKGIILTDNSDENLKDAIKKVGYEFVPKIKTVEVNYFKGQSACRGKVEGKVRVIMSKKEIPKLESGEILVTAMTTPEYLPAMSKARAFITDEGGITCHAAIIAREMKKPCIIGTKIATSILKDGYLVEVDADSGVVKILKK